MVKFLSITESPYLKSQKQQLNLSTRLFLSTRLVHVLLSASPKASPEISPDCYFAVWAKRESLRKSEKPPSLDLSTTFMLFPLFHRQWLKDLNTGSQIAGGGNRRENFSKPITDSSLKHFSLIKEASTLLILNKKNKV